MLRSPAHASLLDFVTQADVVIDMRSYALELHYMSTVLMLSSNAQSINASTTGN